MCMEMNIIEVSHHIRIHCAPCAIVLLIYFVLTMHMQKCMNLHR